MVNTMKKNNQSICQIDSYGTKRWYLNGLLHREDGPAVEYTDGTKEWYLHGQLHREGGPAIEHFDSNEWYLNDKRHREDGPAVKYFGLKENRDYEWWYHGEEIACLSQEEFLHEIAKKNSLSICETDEYGTKRWYLNDLLHREDGPAVKDACGNKVWYLRGRRHREDGPAAEYADGSKAWYYHGKNISCSSQEEFEKAIFHKVAEENSQAAKTVLTREQVMQTLRPFMQQVALATMHDNPRYCVLWAERKVLTIAEYRMEYFFPVEHVNEDLRALLRKCLAECPDIIDNPDLKF